MNPDSSPFTPGRPASAESFIGRKKQVEELLTMVRLARKKRLQVGWISGERGIGKSSLAAFVGSLAERDEKAVVAHVHLGRARNLEDLVRETYVQILKDTETRSWGKAIWKAFGERVERVGLWGVDITLKATPDDFSAAASMFAETLSHTLKTAGKDRKVLVLILDDINGLADNPAFSHWIKKMVDSEVTSRKENHVCLIFVGFDERRCAMMKLNPSVGRVFQPLIDIKPWAAEESEDFFRRPFEKHHVAIGDREIRFLAHYSGGLPVVAHEIGHAVWEIAKDKKIGSLAVKQGVLEAAGRFGRRMLHSGIVEALHSEQYRSILQKTAEWLPLSTIQFSKEQLQSLAFTGDEKTSLNSFLRRMGKLGAIVPVFTGDERDVYRFATWMHRLYFFLAATDLARKPNRKVEQSLIR